MSVELTLLIASHTDDPESPGLLRCRTRLGLERDSLLWDEIELMDPEPIHEGAVVIDIAGHLCFDWHGEPLTWVSPNELAECLNDYLGAHDWAEPPTPTVAAAAYLAALPVGTPVILYWH